MSTVRTFPRTLAGVGVRAVEHADDEMALQAHRRLAINPFAFNNFSHFSKALGLCRANPDDSINTWRQGFRRLKSENLTILNRFGTRIPDHWRLSY